MLLSSRRKAARADNPRGALLEGVRSTIFAGRQQARTLGRASVLSKFGITSEAGARWALLDSERALQLARAHVGHVELAAAQANLQAAEHGGWATAVEETEWRARRLAATEIFSAASAARVETAIEAEGVLGVELWKEWNASADACPVCAQYDGDRVRVSDSFHSGFEPGSVHPSCRCWVEIFTQR